MKKTPCIIVVFLAAVLCMPCFAKSGLPGLARGGQYGVGILRGVPQPDTLRQPLDGVYGVGVYPLHTPELPPGEGREGVQAYCGFCHGVLYVTMQPPLPPDVWATEVYKMVNAYGALIPEDETKRIIAYLQAHYTPETRRQ